MLVLASKSPRRREILEMMNIEFKVLNLDVEENVEENNPIEYVKKTAMKKGLAASDIMENDTILSCDTIVVLENEILEKPISKEDAFNMIKKISGKNHLVYTGVYIANKSQNYSENFYVGTKVMVDELTDEEIKEYINTNEPYDKAGGYAIQGLFGKFIKGIEGDYFNVVGLPINEIYSRLKKIKFL